MGDAYKGQERRADPPMSEAKLEDAAAQAREEIETAAEEARKKVLQTEKDRKSRARAGGALLVLTFIVALFSGLNTIIVPNRIQDSRREFVRTTCEEQNARNEQTVSELDRLANKEIARKPEKREVIRRNQEGTIALIDALVPVYDCDDRVEQLTELD